MIYDDKECGCMMRDKLWFAQICKKNNFDISEYRIELLDAYVLYILSWNRKINLISRRDEENVWSRHILGSIAFLFNYRIKSSSEIVDVGSGGGLPGVPLAIMLPGSRLTLIDSIQKKINALTDILSRLNLANVSALCGRAEDLSSQETVHHTFDYVIARAVGPIKDIVKRSERFLKPASIDGEGGIDKHRIYPGAILLLKGGELTTELEQARVKLNPRAINSYSITIEGVDSSYELIDKKLVVVYP